MLQSDDTWLLTVVKLMYFCKCLSKDLSGDLLSAARDNAIQRICWVFTEAALL